MEYFALFVATLCAGFAAWDFKGRGIDALLVAGAVWNFGLFLALHT